MKWKYNCKQHDNYGNTLKPQKRPSAMSYGLVSQKPTVSQVANCVWVNFLPLLYSIKYLVRVVLVVWNIQAGIARDLP